MMVKMNTFLCFFICYIIGVSTLKAQDKEVSFIRLVNPLKEKNQVSNLQQFIIGSTCKTCSLTINDQPVKIQNSGGFAFEVNLSPGTTDTLFKMQAIATNRKTITKK